MGPERVEENGEKEPAEKNALERGVRRKQKRGVKSDVRSRYYIWLI